MLSRILVLAAGIAAALAMATPVHADDYCVYYAEGSYGPLARYVSVGGIDELIGEGPGGDMGEICIPFE